MKKTLIGGSLLAVFLLLMLPTVAAEEAKVAQSAPASPLLGIETAYLEELREQLKDGPSPQLIFITLAILFLKLVRWGIIIFGGIIFLIILKILRKNNSTAVF